MDGRIGSYQEARHEGVPSAKSLAQKQQACLVVIQNNPQEMEFSDAARQSRDNVGTAADSMPTGF
jgi:hypothetical protein